MIQFTPHVPAIIYSEYNPGSVGEVRKYDFKLASILHVGVIVIAIVFQECINCLSHKWF